MKTKNSSPGYLYRIRKPASAFNKSMQRYRKKRLRLQAHPRRIEKTLKTLQRVWEASPQASLTMLLSWINYDMPTEIWGLSDKELRNRLNAWSKKSRKKQEKKKYKF